MPRRNANRIIRADVRYPEGCKLYIRACSGRRASPGVPRRNWLTSREVLGLPVRCYAVAHHLLSSTVSQPRQERSLTMLWTIFVILLILWALGMVSGSTMGGFIHLLLILAIVVVLVRIIQGRRPV